MKNFINGHRVFLAGIFAVALAHPAFAMSMPQPQHIGNVTFISGGVGDNEADALRSSASNYNLRVSNADHHGAFITDTDVIITSKDKRNIVHMSDSGPLLYARLPPGHYTVEARNGTQHVTKQIAVTDKKPANLHFVWRDEI